jgi:protein-S-isoprenylcysteine O-methyltransferase Ste14
MVGCKTKTPSIVELPPSPEMILYNATPQTLITHGVYRTIRHPMYASGSLLSLAQALLLQNWVAGPAGVVAFLPLYFVRVPREEQMMLDHFGDDYRSYAAQTGRIVPRLCG